jgi:TPR repeat protein
MRVVACRIKPWIAEPRNHKWPPSRQSCAADAGLAEGALALAATFDPDELARRQVLGGVQPDRAAARRWYERALELGASEAENYLRRLDARNH